MLRATLFYPVDSYPLDRRFIHWIGLIHWISYPPFEQPAPDIYMSMVSTENTVNIFVLHRPLRENTRLARLTSAGSRAGNFVSDCSAASRAALQYTVASNKICAHYQGTGSRIFSDEKLSKLHSIPSILLNLPF